MPPTNKDDDPALAAALAQMATRYPASVPQYRIDDIELATTIAAHRGDPPLRLHPYVCSDAWAAIVLLAIKADYVAPESTRPSGVSKFIVHSVMHPLQIWDDTRPEWMRATDLARAAAHRPPMWQDPDHCRERKTPRLVIARGLDLETLDMFVSHHKLAHPEALNPASLRSPHVQLGALLETWGQGHITPLKTPTRPPQHADPRRLARNSRVRHFEW